MSDVETYLMPGSYAQASLWLTQQLDPLNPSYLVPMSLRLRGRLDRAALERALAELVRRHESLRTTFVERDAEVMGVIAADPRTSLAVVDLSPMPDREREHARRELVAEEASRPFDLGVGPLLRHTLIVLGPDDHQLLIVTHHIVIDAWSQDIYFHELGVLYEAYAAGTAPELPEPGLQYADYALWQREQFEGGALSESLAYWREKLDGASATALPYDRPWSESADHANATRGFTVPAPIVERLRSVAVQEQATLFMVLLAVCGTMLARLTGETDVNVSSPIAGRTRPELDGVIGYFINTLVLRADLSGDPSFRECVRRVRGTCLDSFRHQDVPFGRIVEEISPTRGASQSPFLRVMFSMQNGPAQGIRLGDLDLGYEPVSNGSAKLDLNIIVVEEPDGSLACTLEYDSSLFDESTAARLGERFATTATSAATAPDLPIAQLRVLGEQEERLLLTDWGSAPAGGHGLPETLHGCLELAVDRFPDRLAVSDGTRTLTYRELDERANQLAHRLIALGVAAESPIGVCTRRDADMLVAIYGVMKAGCAYLPLDSSHPAERIRLMLEDSRAAAVVAHDELVEQLEIQGLPVIGLDRERAALAALPKSRPAVAVSGSQLCYVLFTSGSTGRPKGVGNEHRSLVNLMRWGRTFFSDDELAGFTATCSTGFDVSAMELFIPLSFGGGLVVAQNALDLVNTVSPVPQRVLHSVPSIVTEMLRSGAVPQTLETIVLIGEALTPELAAGLHGRLPGLRLVNEYGVTEAAVTSTSAVIDPRPRHTVPIGSPIRNIRTYVLDGDLRPAPVGVPGELYLAGVGTARGYVGNRALTADRFLPDPFDGAAGSRMYRTGDTARWNSSGQIEYLGRRDNQVKLRGVRIELGEIEAAAVGHEQVAQAAAVVHRGPRGDARLVCFVTAAPGGGVDPDAVLAHLALHLPRYLLPGRLIVLDRFPLSAAGKLNRRALAEHASADAEASGGQRPPAVAVPHGTLEARIAAAWCEVLGVEQVGRNINFFECGGHSLLMLRLRAQLNASLGCDLTIAEYFRHPTVAALARRIAQAGPGALPEQARETAQGRAGASRAVAVVGMACRLPGADGIGQFWANLLAGSETISTLTPEQLRMSGVSAEEIADPDYVPRAGVLEDIDLFDAEYFGLSPREAELVDPQQRLLLELATETLETAGHDPARFAGSIGVFAAVGFGDYLWNNVLPNERNLSQAGGFQVGISVDKDYAATRVAYKLNLRGPAITVQTACSSSLVAVHLAARALLNGETDIALAGGASLTIPARGYTYHQGGTGSPDGHCRPFDAAAQGTVPGSGAGLVALRRLEDALADGDTIHAVITGSAVNNDGSVKAGFTAPSVDGQAAAIRSALRAAATEADSLGYVEAHGTATPLGDPIELAALTDVFAADEAYEPQSCALGSVKGNLGHLDVAAGVTGLIKTILAVEHGVIPATLHYSKPNPHVDLSRTPFYIPAEAAPWPAARPTRRAGTSSFGIGGTNAHVIVEQAPPGVPARSGTGHHTLPLSARTPLALAEATRRLAAHLRDNPDLPLANVAYTLQTGRAEHPFRRAVTARTAEEARVLLQQALEKPEGGAYVDDVDLRTHAAVFIGSGFIGSGPIGETSRAARLAADLPIFRRPLTAACDRLPSRVAAPVRETLLGQGDGGVQQFPETAALVVQYAMALTLADLGVQTSAVLGSGLGCLLAAALADVLPISQALDIAAAVEAAAPELRASRLRDLLGQSPLSPGAIPYFYGPDSSPATSSQTADPEFWVEQIESAPTPSHYRNLSRELDEPVLDLSPDAAFNTLRLADTESGFDDADELTVLSVFGDGAGGSAPAPAFHTALGGLWCRGVSVNWSVLYGQDPARRIPLPTYPFQRKRHWLDVPSETPDPVSRPAADESRRLEPDQWFYSSSWTRGVWRGPAEQTPASWLILTDRRGVGAELADRLRSAGHLVVTAEPGEVFTQLDTHHFAFGLSSAEDAERLVSAVRGVLGRLPQRIVHALCATAEPRQDTRGRALHSVLFLARALSRGQIVDRVDYTILTCGALAVAGERELIPEHALAVGASRVISQEVPQIRTRLVDLEASDAEQHPSRLVARLIDETTDDQDAPTADVAYRGHDRWTQHYEPVRLPDVGRTLLRERGVYLLIGGLGVVGRALAAHLAREHRARLVIVNRTPLPPRSHWDALLCEDRTGSLVARRIESVMELEQAGAEVLTLAADLCDEEAMREVLRATAARFGELHGVFHCAGTVEEGFGASLDGLDRAACDRLVRAKVEGAQVLARVLEGLEPDFILLSSSLSSILGGVDLACYAAANAHLDLFAHRQRRVTGLPWMVVDWEGWHSGSKDRAEPDSDVVLGQDQAALALSAQDGGEILRRVLRGHPAVQTFVSTADLQARRDRWVRSDWGAEPPAEELTLHDRPRLRTPYLEPRDDAERRLSAIWRQLLGIREIGVRDSFFELGGSSLLAIRLVSAIQREFRTTVPLHTVLHASTVESLAEVLSTEGGSTQADSVVVPLHVAEGEPEAVFFWIHPVGGTVLCYRDLARLLGPKTTSYGLQAPMLVEQDATFPDIESLAARYVEEITRIQPNGPYRVGGYSAGGIISVEVARQLAAQGRDVGYVGVIEAEGPRPGMSGAIDPRELLSAVLARPNEAADDLPAYPADLDLFAGSPDVRRAGAASWLAATRLVPADQVGRIARLLVAVADIFTLVTPPGFQRYSGTIDVYRATGETRTYADPTLRWRTWVDDIRTAQLPGTHQSVLEPSGTKLLAELIREEVLERPGQHVSWPSAPAETIRMEA